ncbi:unnamed protein product [Amoebophrya sp. A25]|nr:unnamed protein product [Amoebophrya sp. A25]|eukprot:GSA25T00024104001.1
MGNTLLGPPPLHKSVPREVRHFIFAFERAEKAKKALDEEVEKVKAHQEKGRGGVLDLTNISTLGLVDKAKKYTELREKLLEFREKNKWYLEDYDPMKISQARASPAFNGWNSLPTAKETLLKAGLADAIADSDPNSHSTSFLEPRFDDANSSGSSSGLRQLQFPEDPIVYAFGLLLALCAFFLWKKFLRKICICRNKPREEASSIFLNTQEEHQSYGSGSGVTYRRPSKF